MIGTEDLRSEHVGVRRMLAIMTSMARAARQGQALEAGELDQVVDFLRVFVDKCHHHKEEQLLFPAMRAAGIASAEGTIDGLLAEHVQGRQAVAAIAMEAQRMGEGDESAKARIADVIDGYTALLDAHILREESDCFDVADRELPPSVQTELAEGYDRIERDVVGGGVHEAFHELLDRLGRKYLA